MRDLEKILDSYKVANSDLILNWDWDYYLDNDLEVEISLFVANRPYQPLIYEYIHGEWHSNELRVILRLYDDNLDYKVEQPRKISDSETWAGNLLDYDWADEFSSEDAHNQLLNVITNSFPFVSRGEVDRLDQYDFKHLFMDNLIARIWSGETIVLNKEVTNLINYVKKELNK